MPQGYGAQAAQYSAAPSNAAYGQQAASPAAGGYGYAQQPAAYDASAGQKRPGDAAAGAYGQVRGEVLGGGAGDQGRVDRGILMN